MNGYTYGVVFAKGVTIREVNPDNYHMKNNFADNIFATCLSVLVELDAIVTGIKVLRGFQSLSSLKQSTPEYKITPADKKFCKGLGLEVVWDGYTKDKCKIIAASILTELPTENFNIVIKDKSVIFLRKTLSTKIVEKIGDKYREIYRRQ